MTSSRWRRAVVVGGAGAVGSWFRRGLHEHTDELITIDRRIPIDGHHVTSDIEALSSDAEARLRAADLIVWALPEDVTERVLPELASSWPAATLLVETLSVQSAIAARLRDAPCQVLGVNILFAPSLDAHGRGIALIDIRHGEAVEAMIAMLTKTGARLVRLAAEEHDRAMASVQALTHAAIIAFGTALRDHADIDRLLAVATPPHRMLLGLLARIATGPPEVYLDIQHANPYARDARRALAAAAAGLDPIGDGRAFTETLQSLGAWLGPAADVLAAECHARLAVNCE